jgi:hypothetical protein
MYEENLVVRVKKSMCVLIKVSVGGVVKMWG